MSKKKKKEEAEKKAITGQESDGDSVADGGGVSLFASICQDLDVSGIDVHQEAVWTEIIQEIV